MVLQTFCAKFEETAQQFAIGPQRRFARQFADSFLGIWKQELSSSGPTTPKPTYSSVAATSLPAAQVRPARHHQQQQHRQSDPPHRQGQQTSIAPPRQDLRVFIRLEAGAPARAHSGYAIRTLIREKLGAVSDKIRQVFLVREWFTYVVSDFPKRLTDFHGNEVDSDSIVSDEIEIQTGLTPVDIRPARQFSDNPRTKALLVSFLKPTKKKFWSLFWQQRGQTRRQTNRLRQCETCWGYHFARNCYRQPVCQRCGKTGHSTDDCAAPEQSAEESARRAPPAH
uniref:CCHC-type domain-containing protein n=1 Tax=Fusarium oxysporum (strain Fo5176) TaxID=660025 RepID=A0A0D2YJE1_FUSOF